MSNQLPDESREQVANAIKLARKTGLVAIGILECMVSVGKGKSKLIIVAEDVEPSHITSKLTNLCARKHVPILTLLSRKEIGKCAYIDCPTAAVSIENPGESLSYFQVALRRAHINPKTFHEIKLAAQTMLERENIPDIVEKMNLSLSAMNSLDDCEITDPAIRRKISENLSIILKCSLAIAARLNIDSLQHFE